MVECKLDKLLTEFTPGRITLHIELTPVNGTGFDLPVEEAGKKLGMVANYASATFGVRTAPITAAGALASAPASPPGFSEQEKKLIAKGNARVLEVFEQELERAKSSKDPQAVAAAEDKLKRARERAEKVAPSTPAAASP